MVPEVRILSLPPVENLIKFPITLLRVPSDFVNVGLPTSPRQPPTPRTQKFYVVFCDVHASERVIKPTKFVGYEARGRKL
ncbi:MAG: hypothetical protein QG626_828 [Patescibacteria group bacterium]|nr:hypothetical protein [Patescibacteria group bacterium]